MVAQNYILIHQSFSNRCARFTRNVAAWALGALLSSSLPALSEEPRWCGSIDGIVHLSAVAAAALASDDPNKQIQWVGTVLQNFVMLEKGTLPPEVSSLSENLEGSLDMSVIGNASAAKSAADRIAKQTIGLASTVEGLCDMPHVLMAASLAGSNAEPALLRTCVDIGSRLRSYDNLAEAAGVEDANAPDLILQAIFGLRDRVNEDMASSGWPEEAIAAQESLSLKAGIAQGEGVSAKQAFADMSGEVEVLRNQMEVLCR